MSRLALAPLVVAPLVVVVLASLLAPLPAAAQCAT